MVKSSVGCGGLNRSLFVGFTQYNPRFAPVTIQCAHNFHTSRMSFVDSSKHERILTSDRVSSVLNKLDEEVDDDDLRRVKSQRKLKLNKSLLRPPKKILDDASQGIYDALGGDLADCINDYLMKNQIFRSRSTSRSSLMSDTVVDISTVSLNQDQSHAHAYWSSEPIEYMLKNMLEASKQHIISRHEAMKKSTMTARTPTIEKEQAAKKEKVAHDPMESYVLALRMEKNLTDKLQRFEGKFRSHIIRTINMRRVPRIYFAADKNTKFLLEQLKAVADMVAEK
jgi:ribosome-binding factor A